MFCNHDKLHLTFIFYISQIKQKYIQIYFREIFFINLLITVFKNNLNYVEPK